MRGLRLVSALENETIVFVIVDTILVYIFTWIWFKYIKKTKYAFRDSLEYTVYITVIFMIYYYIFHYYWLDM